MEAQNTEFTEGSTRVFPYSTNFNNIRELSERITLSGFRNPESLDLTLALNFGGL